MALVGFNDLQARSAYRPVIQNQNGRWIAYVAHHGDTPTAPTRLLRGHGGFLHQPAEPPPPFRRGQRLPIGARSGSPKRYQVPLGSERRNRTPSESVGTSPSVGQWLMAEPVPKRNEAFQPTSTPTGAMDSHHN